MKEKINVNAYAETITNALKSGILLNTNGKKFNTMVIGWGGLGICWGRQVFTVYVREGRFTREQLDSTREFTLSVPLDAGNPEIVKICGWQSGRDIDKVQYAHLTLELPEKNSTPAIREYPLTLECKVRSWDPETGYLIGEIVASQADESILTDGKVDLGKLKPIIFDPSFNVYRVVGEAVGNAFQDGLKLK